ncbi:sensor histidine kinase [Spirosoma soli]|uniref:Sensor histidine kinase n=1 Tax=Spirosoma soli TaxID=1770529 RepID=A0ABW5M480_9BACT
MTVKQKTIAIHGLFWTAYFLYSWLAYASILNESCSEIVGDPYEAEFFTALICVPITAAAVYFTINFLIEKYLLARKHRSFYVGLALGLIGFVLLDRVLIYTLIYPTYYPYIPAQFPLLFLPKLITLAVDQFTIVGAAVMIYFANKWNQQRQVNQQLQLAKREAELELLQSQVQPHFIFNTLNNIYALSLKNSPQTPDMIYRLSSLLDYMLYDSKSGRVSLRSELDYINNYLNLQQIRYGTQLSLTLNADPAVYDFVIAPLLLLPFVENCFKHGVCQQLANNWIEIDLALKDDTLRIRIRNSKDADDEPTTGKGGIGLQNVRSRLAILYKDQHRLVITNEPTVFTIDLTIALSALMCDTVPETLVYA